MTTDAAAQAPAIRPQADWRERLVPRGRTLSSAQWDRRHRAMLLLLVAHVVSVPVYSMAVGFGVKHSLVEGSALAIVVLLAATRSLPRRARSVLVGLGLAAASAMIVHVAGGAVEAHFHFFVIVSVLAVYEDWVVFVAVLAFVTLHHGGLGAIAPEHVFESRRAGEAWMWALIHGAFVAASAAGSVIAWQLNGDVRDQTGKARDDLARSATNYRTVIDSVDEVIFQADPEGRWTLLNGYWETVTGTTIAASLGQPAFALIHPDDRSVVLEHYRPLLEGHSSECRYQARYRHVSGDYRWVEARVRGQRGPGGELVGWAGTMTDITERRQREQELRCQYEISRCLGESATLAEGMPRIAAAVASAFECRFSALWVADGDALRCDAVWHADGSLHDRFEDATTGRTFARGEGLPGAVWQLGKPVVLPDLAAADNFPRIDAAEAEGLKTGMALPVFNGGHLIAVLEFFSDTSRPLVADSGSTLESVSAQIGQFVTRRQAEERLAHQAVHDPLTGLPTRALFLDRLQQAFVRARRHQRKLCVLFVDIDAFKAINDSLGHQAGDELLCEVADALRGELRATDTAGRLGGDEFAVVCEDLDSVDDVLSLAQRLQYRFSRPLSLSDGEYLVTVSIGIAIDNGNADAKSLMRDADAAMYRAKQRGRNQYELFDQSMRRLHGERLGVEAGLRAALDGGGLEVHYQPVVALADGVVTGAEALVRWNHPERGPVAPGEFIPVAEGSGLIVRLGDWVLHEACAELARWVAHTGDDSLTMAVNVSPRQLVEADIVQTVADAIAAAGVRPDQVCLEVTETALIDDAEGRSSTALRALKALGVKLALDDFGTGHSSLAHLSRFPIDEVKIDRSFVAGMDTPGREHAIVSSIVGMATGLGLEVVAEGVETDHQRRLLLDLDASVGQGYYFGKPTSADDFIVRHFPHRRLPTSTARPPATRQERTSGSKPARRTATA